MSRFVYADNAATTKMSPVARKAMLPWLEDGYGNPSAVYRIGRDARRALDGARDQVARAIGAKTEEIFFTGSGTESNNWVLRGICERLQGKGKHIITTMIEHHAISRTLEDLEKQGFEVTVLPVDKYGMVSPHVVRAAIRPDTILITIMFANNEIGTIQPIAAIGDIARERGVLFHTDAVQAVGHVPIDVELLKIDLLSLSAHKFRGPRGVGALYVKKGVKLPAFITGGGQEKGHRAGTENVAGIVGMAMALEDAVQSMEQNLLYVTELRDKLIAGMLQLPAVSLTGHPEIRLPGIASFAIACIEGEALILMLDAAGIAASSGSACSSGSLDPSHVLLSIGLTHESAHGSVRLSLGEETTEADVDYILEQIPPIVEKLRAMSPLWEERVDA
ncbi:MAG: cysteine desulfurase NifS [Oscillospiraceae bacterium]|nr:cysteine desulfurase NifS [Oscillospiraceae bacterium]